MKRHDAHCNSEQNSFLLENLIFQNRAILLIGFALLTAFLFFHASQIVLNTNFDKMIPKNHPHIANYLSHKEDLKGLGNAVSIAVEAVEGDIFNAEYLDTLQKINDTVFFISGVDRAALKSLWTPQTRWLAVTEEGFDGGPVIPDSYKGTPEDIDQLRSNIYRSGEIGRLVANNYKSTIVYVPLLDIDPETGNPLDYQNFSRQLEIQVRERFQSDNIKIHITGFAKLVGDLMDAANQIVLFFFITVMITLMLLYLYSRCLRSTMISMTCSLIAVGWQLGLLKLFGYALDPYSMLVPFLIFAIGTSHGVQIINNMNHETMQGYDRLNSARRTFRNLFNPAVTALVTDIIGFGSLLVINIGVIQELAIGSTIGVAGLILTNTFLMPIILSYTGVSSSAVKWLHSEEEEHTHAVWTALSSLTKPAPALTVIVFISVIFAGSIYTGRGLKIGDLDKGAPELYPDSRYNQDIAFIADNYSSSSDVFVVMVKTPEQKSSDYRTLVAMDRLSRQLRMIPEVQSVTSLVDVTKTLMSAYAEGNLKWMALNRNQQTLDATVIKAPPEFSNKEGTISPMIIYLKDHEADTLQKIVRAIEAFSENNTIETSQFLLSAGNAGIEAATNIVISESRYRMLILIYCVVAILCMLAFRSIQGTICVLLPLALTSSLCSVVMIILGIGVKVATLPVIAIGVGIGVDYGIYIYSKYQKYLKGGMPIRKAYYNTLKTTGKAVCFTGITLSVGVGIWGFSAIKFQGDMGILLAFMFLTNMLGAICIIPALIGLFEWLKTKSESLANHHDKKQCALPVATDLN
ncbi:MAG: RND family transporter [Desulfobacteraceae bacterium]|jgi:predicted RND superfamily exporter protein|nr:MAG: RND family transporter [Desulfobacteraceae bacterium]